MTSFFSDAGSWIRSEWKSHWKMITAVAAGTVVAIAVTAIVIGSFGTAVPVLFAAAGASGALASGTTQTVDDLLEGKRPGLDVAESVVIGGAVSAATFGAGRVIAPLVPEAVAAFLPGQAIEPLESEADLISTALRRNVPWSSIPKIIFNQSLPDLTRQAELGIVGALSGATNRAPDKAPAQEAAPPHAPVTSPPVAVTSPADQPRAPVEPGALGD